jgi:hypothetical protein
MSTIITRRSPTDLSQIKSPPKPTTRADGSALVVGDRWYNNSTGIEGFWNGTYWLGSDLLFASNAGVGGNYGNFGIALFGLSMPLSTLSLGIFIGEFTISGRLAGTNDAANYHSVVANSHNGGGQSAIATLTTIGFTLIFKNSASINTAYLFPANGTSIAIFNFYATQTVVGAPSNVTNPASMISYRMIL